MPSNWPAHNYPKAVNRVTSSNQSSKIYILFSADRPATFRLDGQDVTVQGQSFASSAVKTDLRRSYGTAKYFRIGPGLAFLGVDFFADIAIRKSCNDV